MLTAEIPLAPGPPPALFLVCMQEEPGAVRSMSEVEVDGLGQRHVSSISTMVT